jgi:hypothetical protein
MDPRRHKNKRNPGLTDLVSVGVYENGGTQVKQERIIQGTTLSWTEHYGARLSARDRAIEVGRDLVFAITLAGLAAGAMGFVAHAPSSDRMARTVDTNRAL